MRKNYFLSVFLLMAAFWHVEAKDKSTSAEPTSTSNMAAVALTAPTNLIPSSVGGTGTSLTLVWVDNTSGLSQETSFQVGISTDGIIFSPANAPSSLGGFGSTLLPNLQPNTKYWLAVRAVKDGAGPTDFTGCSTTASNIANDATKLYSCWSAVVTATTNPNLPSSPSNAVVATPYSQRSVTLYYNDNSTDEDNFEIMRSMNGGPFVRIAFVQGFFSTGQRSYVDNTVLPNNTYQYRVLASNVAGASIVAAQSSAFKTPPDPPTAPISLNSPMQGLNSIQISWLDRADNEDAFVIERSVDQNSWFVLTPFWPPNNNYYTDQNLIEGFTYYYRVKAVNTGGSSAYTNVLQVSTKKRVAPNPPYQLSAETKSTTAIYLQWTNGAEDGLTNNRVAHEIYRSTVSGTDGFVRIATLTPEQFYYTDNSGQPKTKYWYKLLSTNNQGQSAFSNVATATTLGPPFAPTALTASLAKNSLGDDIISLLWKDNSEDEYSFTVERATDSTFTTGLLTAMQIAGITSATSIPIEEGVTYYYRVKATNDFGDSKYSNIAKATTAVTAVPNMPYGLKASGTATEVVLTWGDDSNKEMSFDVERSTDGTTFTKVGTATRNMITYSDKTVAEKTKYFYRVRAVNSVGNSAYSNVAQVTTPAKPAALAANVGEIVASVNDTWQVFPNPTADAVKVTLPEGMQKQTGIVTITDRMNREVLRTNLDANQVEYRFDLSNFSEGTYTISISTTTQKITKRVYKY